MKNILFLLLVLSFAAFAGTAQDKSQADHNMNGKQATHMMNESEGHSMISVPTIQCTSCVKTITAALEKVDGVEKVNIDLEKKVAHVNYDAKKVKLNDLEKTIAASGYDANDVKRDEEAHSKLMPCCQSER